eukprot:TRINITY_DN65_c0_g5_i2.p2 TRINITY_DN65_c0_g5~~TRINITY_DN65_c0_g5_i2.p2  ORF type:complete len:109 (+),score=24.08 TRINITY_DN65_c0_g5_i2:57-383(+)
MSFATTFPPSTQTQTQTQTQTTSSSSSTIASTVQSGGVFQCRSCRVEFPYQSFGSKSLHPRIVYLEECYTMKDPFHPSNMPICAGSHCVLCKDAVCVDPACSVFYTKV